MKCNAWSALNDVLVANNDTLLKKNIIQAGLGQDVEVDLYNGIQQPWAVLTVRNTNEESYQKLRDVIHGRRGISAESFMDDCSDCHCPVPKEAGRAEPQDP